LSEVNGEEKSNIEVVPMPEKVHDELAKERCELTANPNLTGANPNLTGLQTI
jgi:hypothetical protein